jgi:hypothetical protein
LTLVQPSTQSAKISCCQNFKPWASPKLQAMGIGGTPLKWFDSYMTGAASASVGTTPCQTSTTSSSECGKAQSWALCFSSHSWLTCQTTWASETQTMWDMLTTHVCGPPAPTSKPSDQSSKSGRRTLPGMLLIAGSS